MKVERLINTPYLRKEPLPEPAENPNTVDWKEPIAQIKSLQYDPKNKLDVTKTLKILTSDAREFYSFLQILKLIYLFFKEFKKGA